MTDAPPATTFADDAWIVGLRQQRNDAVAALRARIAKGLSAAIAHRTDVSEADVEDFTQEAVVKVVDRLDAFRGDSKFTTWAMAIAVRVALTALRRRRWKTDSIDARGEDVAASASQAGAAEAEGAKTELLAALRNAIEKELTPWQREVLMSELAGVPQVVLADRLSATPGAIYKATHDARRKLKLVLEGKGWDAQSVLEVLAAQSQDRSR